MVSTVNLGFENKLWEIKDKLRGNIESSEYKHVILGLANNRTVAKERRRPR